MNWSRNHLALAAGSIYIGWTVLKSPLFESDVMTAVTGLALLTLCVGPSVAWLLQGMTRVPLFEVFCLAHFPYYWMPATRAGSVLWEIPESFRVLLLSVVCAFLSCGALVYYSLVRRFRQRGPVRMSYWSKPVDNGENVTLFWLCLGLWSAFQIGLQGGWLPNLGSGFPYVRSACTVAAMIGIFYFAGRLGNRSLSKVESLLFLGLLLTGTAYSIASGFLVSGTIILCSALFSFTISRGSVPLITAALVFATLNFLNVGKAEFRQKYWDEGTQGTPAGTPVVELYSYWIQSSLYVLEQGKTTGEDEEGTSLTSRTDLTRMLGIVVSQTPYPLDYLNGESYLQSLALFVPRILWKNRPDVHSPMQRMGLYYGVHTEESMQYTSISFGQIAEAWANFGWLGVIAVGALMGAFFATGVSVSFQQPINSVGYFFGVMFIGWALNVEHSFGPFLMQFYQTALVTLIGLYLLAKRTEALRDLTPPADGA
jgi:hypothetical protein